MKLYGSLVSPYVARVVLAARYKGLALAPETPPGGGIKSPEYLAINPMGKMPTLEDGGHYLAESMVILEYLDDAYPQKSLLPPAALDRARVRLLGRITDLYVMSQGAGFFRNMNPAQRNQTEVEASKQGLAKAMADLEHFMGGGPFALYGAPTQADCAMLPCLLMMSGVVAAFGITDLYADRPRLKAWFAHMQQDSIAGPFIAEYNAAMQAFFAARR